MASTSPIDPWPSIIAGRLITAAMVSVTKTFDAFSGWLLTGYAAVLALLLSRFESINHYIGAAAIQRSATIFLVAAGIGLVAKYIASVVISSGQAAALGEDIGKKAQSEGASVELTQLLAATINATPYPSKWFVRLSTRRLEKNEFDGPARLLAHLTQIHGTLIFIEALLVLWSGYVLIKGMVA